jgi:hypothetical protein
MSKKKNTLKDLDEFLKQQAATLVTPDRLGEKVDEPAVPATVSSPSTPTAVSSQKILNDLKALAIQNGSTFRNEFYDLMLKSIESQHAILSEDMMLINTLLYLKHGDNWKIAIKEYWRTK